jgi:putative hydrolase of the HAD superfamily
MRPRAIVFDLDDTLYRERRYALSGYRAVAEGIAAEHGIGERDAFRVLVGCLRRGNRARAFQELARQLGVPEAAVPAWVGRYRAHAPRLRLAPDVRDTLVRLRGGWRLGVLTNGLPAVQGAKVRALGLDGLVDAIAYADEVGGKPAPAAFLAILSRLDVEAARTVFAGDDPSRDIEGARRAGMKTVLVSRRGETFAVGARGGADAVVHGVSEVPAVAERLLGGGPDDVH